MNIQIFGKNKCFDTKKAQRWFKERGIKFQMIDLAQKGMSKGELDSVLKAVGGLDNLLDQKSKSYASLAYLAYDEDKKEKLLEDGKTVLFTGCACQVAGLRAFLQKPYDGLYTMDVACHGVPLSQPPSWP